MCAAPYLAKPPALPVVNPLRCTGCGRCVAACESHALSLEAQAWRKTAVLHAPQACTGCADCVVACPFGAIRLRRGPAAPVV